MLYSLVDTSNIINISYSVFLKNQLDKNGKDYIIKEDDLGLFWHLFVRKISSFFTTYKNNIFCFEGLNSTKWRKEVYPPYKANREARKSDPNYEFISKIYQDTEKLLSMFPCKTLRVENCEADDCIYVMSKYLTEQENEVIICSGDKDLIQIKNFFDGVEVYNPIKKISQKENKNILLEKSICGDKSDNILGLPRIGEKTLEKMLNDKVLWNTKMTPENLELFENIMSIVDLRRFPQKFQDAILNDYKSKEFNKFNKNGVEAFFVENALIQCLNDWGRLSSEIEYCIADNNVGNIEDELEELLNGM